MSKLSRNGVKVVAISGGFDPLHIGHLDLINAAAELGDALVVIINNDEFLLRKKGYVFMNQNQRARIVASMIGVNEVYISKDEDDTVCAALMFIGPNVFANGGDRVEANRMEDKICKQIGCKQVFGVGGKKTESSSQLIGRLNVSLGIATTAGKYF